MRFIKCTYVVMNVNNHARALQEETVAAIIGNTSSTSLRDKDAPRLKAWTDEEDSEYPFVLAVLL
jgi:hypothetical protein